LIASVRCPRLVGRAKETAFFRERLADAERGRGSLTFISGEAGIGKTRLVRDFLQLPELRRVPRAIGYCTEHAPSPLAPLSDIIWSLLDEHLDLLVDAPITRRILARLVPSLAHENDEATVSIDVRAQYAALVDLFRRASERRPVIIAIDDAQWADLSTIAFVAFFAGRLAGTRAMMFVMQRLLGEGTDPSPTRWRASARTNTCTRWLSDRSQSARCVVSPILHSEPARSSPMTSCAKCSFWPMATHSSPRSYSGRR